MIRFPCRCNFIFDLPEDQAGGVIQCPQCGRLNDIPTLSDLASITDDGTYKIETPAERAELDRLAKLQRSFTKQRVDDAGDEIDLRLTMDEIRAAGADEVPLELRDEVRPGAPKYDPVTGELVRPLDVKKDAMHSIDPDSVPMAKAVVHYATADFTGELSVKRLMLNLFNVPSSIVIFSVFFAHAFMQLTIISGLAGFFFVVPVTFLISALLLAHYANVIDEIGPTQRDELPRLFRELGWHDDLWGPFVRFFFALMLCYVPAIAVAHLFRSASFRDVPVWLCLMLGTFFFPAVVLTLTTSGSYVNLRPDKIWAVIAASGMQYFIAAIGWLFAASIYLAGFVETNVALAQLFQKGWGGVVLSKLWWLAYPLLLAGIYLMHAECAYLGLLYRRHYDQFGWLLQRFEKETPRRSFNVLPRLKKPSSAKPPSIPVQPLGTAMDEAARRRARMQSMSPPPPPAWEINDHIGHD